MTIPLARNIKKGGKIIAPFLKSTNKILSNTYI